jgi:hypothetical protein
MTKKEYRAYLRSKHWRRKRAEFWKSKRVPNSECVCCGGPPSEIHHRTYARLGRERLRDLAAVCRRCHWALHALERERGNRSGLIPALRSQLRKSQLERNRGTP